ERERDVAYASAHPRAGKIGLDPARRVYEVDRIIAMFLETCGHGQDVWIENDIVRLKTCTVRQQVVSSLANFHFALEVVSLSCFVERHHNDRRPVATDPGGLLQKILFPVFQADRVNDRLALNTF